MSHHFGTMQIDELDRQLLARLQANARESTAALARALGVSRTTVQSRMRRLERNGVVAGYTVRLSSDYERRKVRAHVLINARPQAWPRTERELGRIPQVTALYSVSGIYDLIAIVAADSVEELDQLMERIGSLEGVDKTTSSIILSNKFLR